MALINLSHLLRSTKHSMAGIRGAFMREQAFRHEAILLGVIVVLLMIIRPGVAWSAALLGGWLLVMVVELLNSAIEEVCDLVSTDYNEHIKNGKDMASAAVFFILCVNGILWLAMLWDLLML